MDGPRKGTAANVWEEDEIELKIDPQPKDSVTNSIWDTRLTALGMGTTGTGGGATVAADSMNNVPDSLKMWSRRIIPGGSALEWAIDWRAIKSGTGAEMVSVKLDSVFGLGINQHDNDKTSRQASITWAAAQLDAIWNTPKFLGTVKFLAGNKLELTAKNNMTGLTNKVPFDGTPFYMRIDALRDPFYNSLAGPGTGYLQIRSYAFSDNGAPVNDADLS